MAAPDGDPPDRHDRTVGHVERAVDARCIDSCALGTGPADHQPPAHVQVAGRVCVLARAGDEQPVATARDDHRVGAVTGAALTARLSQCRVLVRGGDRFAQRAAAVVANHVLLGGDLDRDSTGARRKAEGERSYRQRGAGAGHRAELNSLVPEMSSAVARDALRVPRRPRTWTTRPS